VRKRPTRNVRATSRRAGAAVGDDVPSRPSALGVFSGSRQYALNDVLGGRIDVQCDQTTTTSAHIRSGAVKGYAVTLKSRVASMTDLPTLHDSGLRDFELAVWYGVLAPKGLPRDVLERHAAALKAAVGDPAFARRLTDLGAQPVADERVTPAGFGAYFRAEVAKWTPIIRAAGVYAD
jgi:putative tricarboxylic transport membrane protein